MAAFGSALARLKRRMKVAEARECAGQFGEHTSSRDRKERRGTAAPSKVSPWRCRRKTRNVAGSLGDEEEALAFERVVFLERETEAWIEGMRMGEQRPKGGRFGLGLLLQGGRW